MIALPILVPLVAAAACSIAWRTIRVQRAIAVATSATVLVIGMFLLLAVMRDGELALLVGDWPRGVAIRLRADLFGCVMIVAVAAAALAIAVFAIAELPGPHVKYGTPALMMLVLGGSCGVFLTADLFNLYVWLEVLLIASFVLVALGGTRPQLRGGTTYVILNVLASVLILTGIALVYASVHALDLGIVRGRLAELAASQPNLVLAIEVLLLAGIGIKAAVFPLFFWLPAAYPTPAPSITALFAGLAEIGVFAMVRVVIGTFPTNATIENALVVVAGATMLTGCAAAIVQARLRAVMSYLDIGHIGFLVAGLALATHDAIAGSVYYFVHHLIVTANLFLIAGAIRRARRHEDLAGLGGLARERPLLAASFVVTGLSLAGIPPLSGFWAKLGVLKAVVAAERWWLAASAIVASVLTLIAFARMWSAAFAGQPPDRGQPKRDRGSIDAPIVALTVLTLLLGVVPEPLLAIARDAATSLLGGVP